jgi:hypothetical protein
MVKLLSRNTCIGGVTNTVTMFQKVHYLLLNLGIIYKQGQAGFKKIERSLIILEGEMYTMHAMLMRGILLVLEFLRVEGHWRLG